MTVTIQQFAKHLLAHSVYAYRNNETVHCYVGEDGCVRYFANWGYGDTPVFASLKTLMRQTTGRDLPTAEDLAAARCQSERVSVKRINLRAILDYLHDSEADHFADTAENHPEDVNTHVYRHVLAIEAQWPSAAAGAQ